MHLQPITRPNDSLTQPASFAENLRCYNPSLCHSIASGSSQAFQSISHSLACRSSTSRGPSCDTSHRLLHRIPLTGPAEDHALFKPEDAHLHFKDMNHHVLKATMRSQEIYQMLSKNLLTYHTLQSLLSSRGSCDESDDKTAGAYPAATNLAEGDGSMGKFKLSSVHEQTPVLRIIDNALDAASSSAVRHNIEPHFIATSTASIEKRSSTDNPFTPSVDQYSHVDNTTHTKFHRTEASTVDTADSTDYVPFSLLTKASISNPDVLAEEMFICAWKRDHPDATPVQVQQRLSEWRKDQIGRVRLQLRQEISRLHQEREREEMACASDAEGHLLLAFGHDATQGDTATSLIDDQEKPEAERQRSMWERFIEAESSPFSRKLPLVADAAPSEIAASSSHIVKDYAADHSVRDWIRSRGWIHRTHLHEAAALLIQRVFRGYTARGEAQRRRVARFLAFDVALKAEEATKRQWEFSLKIFQQGSRQVQSTRSLNALLFFENKTRAIIKMNRARKAARAAAEAEVVYYAATSIQRVFRGYRARQLVYGMRHPEWLAEMALRLPTQAAIRIQTIWRGYHARSVLHQRHKAACVIQRAYRFHCARALLKQLRLKLKRKSMKELRFFAIHIIVRFLKKCCSKKRAQNSERVELSGSVDQETKQNEEKM